MFDFINQKYGEYLVGEGSKLEKFVALATNYDGYSSDGWRRRQRRALAKAIYALNYYQLGIIRNCINAFKEQAPLHR